MKKTVVVLALFALLAASVALAGDMKGMKGDMTMAQETYKGWVTDSKCAAIGHKECGDKDHLKKGAKLAFVDDADGKIYTVANPQAVAEHQGHHVEIKGKADAGKGTIQVQSVSMLGM